VKVTTVDLGHCEVSDKDLECLADLRDLERLHLPATDVGDKTLETIAGLPKLRRLSLWRTNITDRGIEHLGRLASLEALDIQETAVTQKALGHLEKLPNLAFFRHDIPLGDEGLASLRRFARLGTGDNFAIHLQGATDRGTEQLGIYNRKASRLELRACWLAAGWKRLAAFPKIEQVKIANMELGPEAMTILTGLAGLREFGLERVTITGGCERLAGLPAILSLKFAETPCTAEMLSALAVRPTASDCPQVFENCPGATIASLGRTWGGEAKQVEVYNDAIMLRWIGVVGRFPVRDSDLAGLAAFPRLPVLNVQHDRLTAASLACLKDIPSLQSLSWNAPVTDETLARIARAPDLRLLEISQPSTDWSSRPSLAGLRHLASLERLAELRCCGVRVTDKGMAFLEEMPWLHRLTLLEPDVTDAGLVHLRNLQQLEMLELDCPLIGDAGVARLQGLSHLRELRLGAAKVTDAGVKKLQKALPNCKISR
jgi:hypothetical protein